MRVQVTCHLGKDRQRWDELVAAQPLPSPFLRSWWLEHAAEDRPSIVLCRDGQDLVGGAAFEVGRLLSAPVAVERVRCLGQGDLAPDHLDLVAEPGREAEVCERVLGWLRRPGSRVVDLDGLSAGGRLGTALAAHVVDRVAAPYAELPADADDYLAGRPGKVRSTVSRSRKRLERDGATIRRLGGSSGDGDSAVTDPEALEEAFGALAELHDGRWADESVFLRSWNRFASAARSGSQAGDVRIVELVGADGKVAATELDLALGGRVAFYQAGRRTDREWRGSGSVLRQAAIEWAVEDGFTEYDLLRGDEPYKADWATGRRELVRVRFGVGVRGRAVEAARRGWVRVAPIYARARNSVRDRLIDRAAS